MSIDQMDDGVWIATAESGASLTDQLAQLRERFCRASDRPDIIVDMTEIKSIDSSTLSQLLRLRKQVRDGGALLYLVSVRDPIWNVFVTTGLDRLFNFAPDAEAALSQLKTSKTE